MYLVYTGSNRTAMNFDTTSATWYAANARTRRRRYDVMRTDLGRSGAWAPRGQVDRNPLEQSLRVGDVDRPSLVLQHHLEVVHPRRSNATVLLTTVPGERRRNRMRSGAHE